MHTFLHLLTRIIFKQTVPPLNLYLIGCYVGRGRALHWTLHRFFGYMATAEKQLNEFLATIQHSLARLLRPYSASEDTRIQIHFQCHCKNSRKNKNRGLCANWKTEQFHRKTEVRECSRKVLSNVDKAPAPFVPLAKRCLCFSQTIELHLPPFMSVTSISLKVSYGKRC